MKGPAPRRVACVHRVENSRLLCDLLTLNAWRRLRTLDFKTVMFSDYDFKIKKVSSRTHCRSPQSAGAAAGTLPSRGRPPCSATGPAGAGPGVRSELAPCRKRGTHRPGPQVLGGVGVATAHLGARCFAEPRSRDARPAPGFAVTPRLCRALAMRLGALLRLEAGCPESPPVYPTCRREPPESQGAAPREELCPLAAPVGSASGRGPPPSSQGVGGAAASPEVPGETSTIALFSFPRLTQEELAFP